MSGTTVASPDYASRADKNFHITSSSPCYAQTGDIAQAVDYGAGPTDGPGGAAPGADAGKKEDVVDAEFTEVDDDKKNKKSA